MAGNGDEEMVISKCSLLKSKVTECTNQCTGLQIFKQEGFKEEISSGNVFQTAWWQSDTVNCNVCPFGYINRRGGMYFS